MIAIIDYDAGNIKECGESHAAIWDRKLTITRDRETIHDSRQGDPSGSRSIWRCDGKDSDSMDLMK